ncbi:FAD-dependent oxidoreductase [Bradyrhizobium sp. 956_D2_N1_5]|uniref:FAD-dependent oxidoreductase n=1 Tax=unclassified Bradyrhizobium TaxID=2631580 RepID=UPI003F271405
MFLALCGSRPHGVGRRTDRPSAKGAEAASSRRRNCGTERVFCFSMVSTSLWMATEILPAAGALKGGVHCDVAVVGSGIAGISTAYELCKRDQSIIVIDRKGIVSGMTARTSAHLAPL